MERMQGKKGTITHGKVTLTLMQTPGGVELTLTDTEDGRSITFSVSDDELIAVLHDANLEVSRQS